MIAPYRAASSAFSYASRDASRAARCSGVVQYAVSQMPVVKAEPPVMAAEIVGSVGERELLDALFAGRARLADRLEQHMGPPLPIIGSGEPVSAAVAQLEKADALVVLDDGKPVGVITRQDLLGFLASG